MGHGSSRLGVEGAEEATDGSVTAAGEAGSVLAPPSRTSRLKNRLHLRRNRPGSSASHSHTKPLAAGDFAGIALITLISAEMRFKDKWLACVSLGEQTFRTHTSDHTNKPSWNSEKKLLLEKNGAHVARVSVFETNRVSRNNLIGWCEIDLLEFLARDSDIEVLELLHPSTRDSVVGHVSLSCSIEDPIETEQSFSRRILSVVDYNEDGKLSYSEFSDLINAFGNQSAANKKEELFQAADRNRDGVVSMDELADLLTVQQEKEPLISRCPVCGENLEASDELNSMIHLTLCFDEGTGNQVMTGGFLTDRQASYGWIFKLSEWANISSYDIGLKSGSVASHIVVYDRRTKRLVEEIIDGKILLAMRAIYQSKLGLGLMDKGVKELLQSISEKHGRRMNSAESSKDIEKFILAFKVPPYPCTDCPGIKLIWMKSSTLWIILRLLMNFSLGN